jgi:copper(I)-binding protein
MDVVKRLPLSLAAAVLLTLVGLAGLARGAVPLGSADAVAGSEHGSSHDGGQPLVVSGAYVREPANGVSAAAYFTIYNTSDTPDTLRTVQSGAGADTTLHTDASGTMQDTSSLSIPAHGSVSLSPGKGHVMITKLYGPLKAGQSVNLQLSFDKSGQLLVTAPVIGVTAPTPTAVAPR